jgi:uncharacterized membrane protein YedE/YeeE
MRNLVAAHVTGTLFGAGLALSDMINPARVLGFLDVLGAWDPTLAFVMAGALIPSALGYGWTRRLKHPLLHSAFHIPENRIVDKRLVAGGLVFGIGWGMAGYCPGPAVAGLGYGLWQPWLFVAAMLAGMVLHRLWAERPRPAQGRPQPGS